ncbi:glycoside hydrolase family 2 TIM barrel-domain containing protein [Treponema sp.]|uniref:glycoside hydrolase family 2 protein n=1 Tax=Treponema sp. TaxID=166 RepID=UPI00388F2FFD
MPRIYLNNDWEFSSEFSQELTQNGSTADFEKVRIPHSFTETPFNSFSTDTYQKNALYRRTFITENGWEGKKILLTLEGAAHESEVFLNGKSLAVHKCGYTAFSVDLTENLAPSGSKNLLAIRVDSRESLNQPPFGFVIDYMTYGGIYRDVYIEIKNPVYIENVFVKTKGIEYTADVKIAGINQTEIEKYRIINTLKKAENAPLSTNPDEQIRLWSVDEPYLYILETSLFDSDKNLLDTKQTRFGFRDILFDESGFYLNGQKIKLRGLNRHQSWPYAGYAMPKNMQRDDADILKYELGLNEVRTSHYPQSHYFIDRCDETGLLVFTEIPGWQHIGNAEWKDIAVENVRQMIIQWRNHPSIFIWGVRINESLDDDEFYTRTNADAHELDSTRPTGGVRFLRNSSLLEDVYTFNDFSFFGENEGCLPKKKVTKTKKGYMITEYNGHMFPTKTFDCEAHRTEHALRHAKVLDAVAARSEISGSSGWCMSDYNTHKDFGSGDYICYHGVLDMFRNSKMAAKVYQSQQCADITGDVLEVTSSMDIGEHAGGARGDVYIITNADSVKMYVNDIFIKEYSIEQSPFKNLLHGPILIDDYIGHRLVDEDGIKEKYSVPMKAMLFALQKYGVDKLPFKYILKGLGLWIRRVTNPGKLRDLYGKYIGNWGGQAVKYRFDSYRNGKLVKTLTKTPAKQTFLKLESKRTTLIEEESYDVAFVSLKAADENGNVQPYCQEAVLLEVEGSIELIGPKAVSLKGGMAGFYVKSCGKKGEGRVKITDWNNQFYTVNFVIKI